MSASRDGLSPSPSGSPSLAGSPASLGSGSRETTRDPGALARLLLLLAVFLTGATALAYEVAWTRGLVRVLGSTATTTAVVLAVFVGALGLGARWGGHRADVQTRPLLLYGLLEVGAALWAVLALHLAGVLEAPYAAVAGGLPVPVRFLLRVAVAAAVVAPGAFLLGATLPAVVRFWVGRTTVAGRGTAWLYGANTLGAVLGTVATGFFGIEAYGVLGWLVAAATVGGLLGLLAAAVGTTWRVGRPRSRRGPASGPGGLPLRPAFLAAALCGAIGLGLEVTGFRILVFFVEGFTATFAAMLAVFIGGLGAGSLLLGPWLTRRKRPDRALGLLLVAAGAVLFLELWVVLPGLEGFVGRVRQEAFADADVRMGIWRTAIFGSAALLLAPAVLLGATFPLCVRWAELAGLSPGAAVGRVYLANSVGTVLAPFAVGFVLIPWMGATEVWRLLALAAVFSGTVFTFHVGGMRTRPATVRTAWGIVGLLLVVLAVGPRMLDEDDAGARLVRASHVLKGHPDRELLAVRTDAFTTASVIRTGEGERILYTDDFAAAATGRHYRYMRMLGHLPVLLAANPRHAMVIAFGTGTTAGAVAGHEDVRRLEVVEVSDAVFDLASYFSQANRGVLDDPRTVRIEDDGRNALLLHAADLDVITLEPLMPYSPAGLPFYTREFYELAFSRLREGGVLCQWVPVHAMPVGLYAAFVRTFFETFPGGALWFFEQSSALIAIKGAPVDLATFERRATRVADDLAAAGFTTPRLVFSAYVASGRTVLAAPRPPSEFGDRTITDLDPYPEFHPTPRAPLNTTYLKDTLEYLWSLTSPGDVPPGLDPEQEEARRLRMGLANGLRARAHEAVASWSDVAVRAAAPGSEARAALARQANEAWHAAARLYGDALRDLPGEAVLTWRRARAARRAARPQVLSLLADARRQRAAGNESELEDALRAALGLAETADAYVDGDAISGERDRAAWLHAMVLLRMGRCQGAERVLLAACADIEDGSASAAFLDGALEAVRAHGTGGRARQDPRFAQVISSSPPCREEGLALLATPRARWREVAGGMDWRALRLAADNLAAAARREGLEQDLYRALTGEEAPGRAEGRAVVAGLLARLGADDAGLRRLLSSRDPAERRAALSEAGRLHLLSRLPLVSSRAAGDEDATVRAAFAAAADEDGDRGVLARVVGLLLDDVRSVRTAAAAALVRHGAALVEGGYDPDADEDARKAAVEKIRAAWKR